MNVIELAEVNMPNVYKWVINKKENMTTDYDVLRTQKYILPEGYELGQSITGQWHIYHYDKEINADVALEIGATYKNNPHGTPYIIGMKRKIFLKKYEE